jgi:hypothetical protein
MPINPVLRITTSVVSNGQYPSVVQKELDMAQHAGTSTIKAQGRPATTARQAGAREVDWARTFHVDNASAFVNGLFGLCSGCFDDFLAEGGKAATVGSTLLFQVTDRLDLRFEVRKIGANEFEVRGAHFHGPTGVNICVGLNPSA